MNLIKGQTVKLHELTKTSTDAFGSPVYTEQVVEVDNVLICPTSEQDITNDIQMYGKASSYTLCIPKGNTNNWKNTIVEFWGQKWRTLGTVTMYQDELVPLEWNAKVKVDLDE